LCIFTVIIL